MINMKSWIQKNKLSLVGVVVGALGGFLYWNYIGCASGTCMITSKPINSTLYGALMGYLLFGMFQKEKIADNKI
jgi:phage shock protein E